MGYSLGNHGRPWACEREGPAAEGRGRDSAKRVVSETISHKVFPEIAKVSRKQMCENTF